MKGKCLQFFKLSYVDFLFLHIQFNCCIAAEKIVYSIISISFFSFFSHFLNLFFFMIIKDKRKFFFSKVEIKIYINT